MRLIRRLLAAATCSLPLSSPADFHLWQVNEFYTNSWGNVQFVELSALSAGQQFVKDHTITAYNGLFTTTFTFPNHLPGDSAGKRMLIGTQSFAALGIVTPDYVVPDNFFVANGSQFRINFAEGSDVWNNIPATMTLPGDGLLSLARNGSSDTNSPTNFAGATGTLFPLPLAMDVNGNGNSDIVWRNAATGQLYRMSMIGGGIVSQGMVYAEPDTNWVVVADGDFNGDGRSDLLWRNVSDGRVYAMPFNGAGEPVVGAIVHTEPNAAWRVVATPDLNGDGRSDLLWHNGTTGQLYGMVMNEGLVVGLQGMIHTEPDTQWRVVATGDLGRVGRDQLIWHHATSGLVYFMTVSIEGGGFRTGGQPIYQEGDTSWSILGAADFDGDLRADLLWRNAATGQVYVMLMMGTAIKGGGIVHTEPNTAWQIVAIGDYNGDFRGDLLWRNSSNGQVYLMRLNGATQAGGAVIHVEPSTSWRVMGLREYRIVGLP